jgi:hypothetical protein
VSRPGRLVKRAGLFVERWHELRVARVALGKYIVLFASLLHLVWAGLLFTSVSAGESTPVHVLLVVFGGRWRTGIVLVAVAGAAMGFLFVKGRVGGAVMGLMLVPQLFALLLSAQAGVWATLQHHYADGVVRAWPFILSDQSPIIILALLYGIAVLEASVE